MSEIIGRVWVFGDHVDTDQIIPAERLVSEYLDHSGDYVFEKVRPGVAMDMAEGDIIVAGKNFGCGSSREHAPRSLMQAGVRCVIAQSFARIFFRNSINIGLPLVQCSMDVEEGDTVTVDLDQGTIESGGRTWEFPRYPEEIQAIIDKGGLMVKVREELGCSE